MQTSLRSESVKVTQLCLTLCNPMDCSLPGCSVHGILQVRILRVGSFPFCKGSSQPSNGTQVFCIAGGLFTVWATFENDCAKPRPGLPQWLSGYRICLPCKIRGKSCKFDPWVLKIPCKRRWQPTPVFFPGKSHGQRSLAGYTP